MPKIEARLTPRNHQYEEERLKTMEIREATAVEGNRSLPGKPTTLWLDNTQETHFPVFPFKDPAFFFARMYPKRSYVLGARVRGTLPDGMFYSTSEPYVSMRSHPTAEGDILLIGGQNHKTGHVRYTSELYRAVERLARERFEVESIEYRWSTQDNVTLDRVPYIGRISPRSQHVYVATGFAGWGMAHSMVAARILSDAILGRSNPWASFYDPLRIKLRDTSKLVTQNLHAVKHLAMERLIAPDSFDASTLPKGAGGVIKVKLENTAVARDDKGNLHKVSPACTHMKCIVTWNDAEQSWDCPCHGSRFSIDGTVIHGPALKPLEKKTPER